MGNSALEGTWEIECYNCKRRYMVGGVTKSHDCACGSNCVHCDGFFVVCPGGHCGGHVNGITQSHKCDTCGSECCRSRSMEYEAATTVLKALL